MRWAPEAKPQSRKEVRRAPRSAEVVAAAKKRRIASIVHFTRRAGLVGILHSSAIKARERLPKDSRLKHVYEPNASDRSLDKRWHRYVNLSVTNINLHMFQSSQHWHPGEEWVILEFGPEILGDPGVVFCTTNNIYPSAHRCRGLQGFEQMFAAEVPGRYQRLNTRNHRAPYQTTDPQAEVLYPFELSLKHLHTVTVPDDHVHKAAEAARSHFRHKPKIKKDPEAFR